MTYGYLFAFAASVLASLLLTPCVRHMAVRRGWTRPPSSYRDVHRTPVPRLGGVAVFAATMGVVAAARLFPRLLDAPAGLHGRVVGILVLRS